MPAMLAWPWYEYLGLIGSIVFYGRFYLQWFVSERRGQVVIPIGFWYLSCVGSVSLLFYSVIIGSPNGALSNCFNIIVYARNLFHIWRERGWMTPRRSILIHAAVALIVSSAIALTLYTWTNEFHETRDAAAHVVRQTWFWIAVGTTGTLLFACRFLVQWYVTEKQRRSVVPTSFWYLSIAASGLLFAAYFKRGEYLLGLGVVCNLPIYLRNLWLLRRTPVITTDEPV